MMLSELYSTYPDIMPMFLFILVHALSMLLCLGTPFSGFGGDRWSVEYSDTPKFVPRKMHHTENFVDRFIL